MLAKAEDGGALLGFVAANAFEDRGAVADDVGKDVKGGVVPVDPVSVVPDFFGLLDRHDVSLFSGALELIEIAEYGSGWRASMHPVAGCGGMETKLAGL